MADMFSKSEAYESLMGRWSDRLAPVFMEFAGVRDGGRVLDVGCGTGALCRAVLDAAPLSEVVGVDPSEPFIAYARERCADPRAAFDVGDALNLPYPDASFDQTLSLLVFQFIPEGEQAAEEMHRVTRPGGTVAACTWDGEGGFELTSAFWDEAGKLDPALKKRGDSRLFRRGQFSRLWDAAGLQDVEETGLGIQMDFASFDDYWLPFLQGATPMGAYVKALVPEGREALREALWKRFLPGGEDGPFALGGRAWAARGKVPG
ncbi:MAG: methyltransferase domain-containing protein [Candidatus Tectomicrobia bacterium]|uniref:Methyltransferase domain-containing protein n=1 Tax=Tectimicrobiota bacterium TaxID=2528274 RepID=A0A932HV07_UNCTE|nr:methyltransferase domain-containing protein [Candidatus Tectomicrobia bacterium]